MVKVGRGIGESDFCLCQVTIEQGYCLYCWDIEFVR